MNTKDTIEAYFDHLSRKGAWQGFFADGVVFTSFTSPIKQVTGKTEFFDSTQRFYSSIRTVELKGLLVDGQSACALTRYEIGGPNGTFECHVAEVFEVVDGSINAFDIYFDSAPFPK